MFGGKQGKILRELCRQKGVEVLEVHARPDHIHLCLSVPPKYSITTVVGCLKGKSAIRIYRKIVQGKGMTNRNFWTCGYHVSTVGLDEKTVREYIKNQENLDNGKQGTLNPDGTGF
jgi:putative transposase